MKSWNYNDNEDIFLQASTNKSLLENINISYGNSNHSYL
jgi:hypothetical protein